MEDAAEADFLGGSGDREIHFTRTHELEHQHPVAQIVEHEDQIVVVLERLAFHARDRFEIFGSVLIVEELADLVVHETIRHSK